MHCTFLLRQKVLYNLLLGVRTWALLIWFCACAIYSLLDLLLESIKYRYLQRKDAILKLIGFKYWPVKLKPFWMSSVFHWFYWFLLPISVHKYLEARIAIVKNDQIQPTNLLYSVRTQKCNMAYKASRAYAGFFNKNLLLSLKGHFLKGILVFFKVWI